MRKDYEINYLYFLYLLEFRWRVCLERKAQYQDLFPYYLNQFINK